MSDQAPITATDANNANVIDTPSLHSGSTQPQSTSDSKLAIVAYALMLATPLLWITALIALVIAYVQRGEATPITKSHYSNIIRCFWYMFVFAIIATVLYAGMIMIMLSGTGGAGIAIVVAIIGVIFSIWIYVRLIKGLIYLLKNKPY